MSMFDKETNTKLLRLKAELKHEAKEQPVGSSLQDVLGVEAKEHQAPGEVPPALSQWPTIEVK